MKGIFSKFRVSRRTERPYGALYYVLNYAKEDSRRFWLSLGFVDKGMDEYGTPLMIKKDS